LYSGALFIKIALGWDLYYSVLLILAMTALCTITGGLAAVIYTEMIQSIIMVGGGLTLMGFAFKEIGGYENLYIKYMQAIPESNLTNSTNQTSKYLECGMPKENSFQILRDISDKEMPWLGFIIGQTPSSIWYWCSDQVKIKSILLLLLLFLRK
jgi:Na+(H+)/acetate symporter ActP